MFKVCFLLFFLIGCSTTGVSTGGMRRYTYNPQINYDREQLLALASDIVLSTQKDPQFGKLDTLFGPGQRPLKRLGIVVFETRIQPTYEGLSKNNKIYLNEAGKQIMTENFLRIWEQSSKLLASELDFISTTQIKRAKSFHSYGNLEKNFVLAPRSVLAPDDIFFLPPGKKTTSTTLLNARGMRDLSFLLVPANELMGGPKWSEHNKHFVNDLAKELNLDAVMIVLSDVSWTVAHTDKHSGEFFPEEISHRLNASILVPLSSYHERLEKIKDPSRPNVTLAFRTYSVEMKIPINLSFSEENQTFLTIERELLAPLMKTYSDFSQMMISRIAEDLKSTW
jgi:hypothetical protein